MNFRDCLTLEQQINASKERLTIKIQYVRRYLILNEDRDVDSYFLLCLLDVTLIN